ncbi:MAG: GAF domain-containing protein [Chloroflexia bacterium]
MAKGRKGGRGSALHDRLRQLHRIGLQWMTRTDLELLLPQVVSEARDLLRARSAWFWRHAEGGNAPEVVVHVGECPVPSTDVRFLEEGSCASFPTCKQVSGSWVLVAPVAWEGEHFGVLGVDLGAGCKPTAQAIECLELLAASAAVSMRNARMLARAQEERRRAEALARATAALTSTLELEPLLENVLVAAIQAIPAAEKGSVLLRDERTGELRMRALIGYADPRIRQVRFPEREGYSAKAAREGRPLLIADARDPSIRYDGEIEEMRAIQSAIVAPLRYRGQVTGVIALDNASRKGAFSEEDLYLLTVFADQAAVAVENARLFESERRRSAELEALRQASLRLTSSLELGPVLQSILEIALNLVAGDDAHLFLYDGRQLTFGAALSADGSRRPQGWPRPGGLTETVARTGERLVIPDVNAHPLYRDWQWGGAIVGIPLWVGDQVVGVMNVAFKAPHEFDEAELRILGLLADQAAAAIANARLYEDLQQQMLRLREAQTRLVHSARLAAIGELAAGVAHELNNPLTSVIGFAEILLEDLPPGSPFRHDVERILLEARRAGDIVRDLLDFARQVRPCQVPTDLNEVLRQTLALTRTRLERNGIAVEESYAEGLPLLPLDAGRMKQVFLNLIQNAAQAMPNGGALRISTMRAGEEVAVTVSDTGVGMPPEVLEHLFEPFFTTKPGGTGLGLSVSLGIVQEHGGRITVESALGKGSSFTVWLPLAGQEGSEALRSPSAGSDAS